MTFIIQWTNPKETLNTAQARFLQTGAQPPAGVKLLGRWHGMGGSGVAIAETTDAKALYAYYAEWSDVLEITITPCVEDADAGAALGALKR